MRAKKFIKEVISMSKYFEVFPKARVYVYIPERMNFKISKLYKRNNECTTTSATLIVEFNFYAAGITTLGEAGNSNSDSNNQLKAFFFEK